MNKINLFSDELLSLQRDMCPDNVIERVSAASYQPYGLWSHNEKMLHEFVVFKMENGKHVFTGKGTLKVIDEKTYLLGYGAIKLDENVDENMLLGFYLSLSGKFGSEDKITPLIYDPISDTDDLQPNSFNFTYSNKVFYVNYFILVNEGDKFLTDAKLNVWLDIMVKSGDNKQFFGNTESNNMFELQLSKLRGNKNGKIVQEEKNGDNKFKIFNEIEVTSRGIYFIRMFHSVTCKNAVDADVKVTVSVSGSENKILTIPAGKTTSDDIEFTFFDTFKSVQIISCSPEVTDKYVLTSKKLYYPYTVDSAEEQTINKVLNQYKNGREIIKLSAVYNNLTKVVVGDIVQIWKCRRKDADETILNYAENLSNNKINSKYALIKDNLGSNKQFVVTSAEITYNGVFHQNLDLLEVT